MNPKRADKPQQFREKYNSNNLKKILRQNFEKKFCRAELCPKFLISPTFSGSGITKVSPQPGLSSKYQPFAMGYARSM